MFEEFKNVLKDRKENKEAKSNVEITDIEQYIAYRVFDKMQYGVRYAIIKNDEADKECKDILNNIRSEISESRKKGKELEISILKIKDGYIIEVTEEYCKKLFNKVMGNELSSEEKAIFCKAFDKARQDEKGNFEEFIKENIRNNKTKIKFAIYSSEKEHNIVEIKRGKKKSENEAYAVKAFAITMEEVAQTCNYISKLGFRINNIFVGGVLEGNRALLVQAEIEKNGN